MKSVLLMFVCAAVMAQTTTVSLRKADGATWTGMLKAHPRVWIDDAIQARISDPDGHGPKVAPLFGGATPNYQADLWRALHAQVSGNSGNSVFKTLPTALLLTGLAWMADNNASFSGTNHNACDATKDANQDLDCYKWWAIDRLKTFDKWFTSNGVCFDTDQMCAYDNQTAGATAYYGDNLIYIAQAYSIWRQFLTPAERTIVSGRIVRGIAPPLPGQARCDNRITFPLPGTFTYTSQSTGNSCSVPYGSLQTPMTGTYTPAAGESLPAGLAGKTIAFHVKWGQSAFSNQSVVTIQTPGYTAGFHTCWTNTGVAIANTKASYAVGITTVTMPSSTALTGTCIANYGNTSRPGIQGVVQSVNPQANTFTFASCPTFKDSINKLYIAADPTPNSCGLAFNNAHHADVTVYPSYKDYWQGQTKLSQAITPTDTVIHVTGAGTWATFPDTPGYVIQVGLDRYTSEMMLVTGVNKAANTLTVVRGFQDSGVRAHAIPTSANAWPVQYLYTIAFQGGSAGWNNRNLTKAVGNLAVALAFYEDSSEAAAILATAVDYYRTDFYEITKKFYTHLNNALFAYGISRESHYIGAVTAMLMSSTNGNLDYRYEKMKDNFGALFPYAHFPWDVKRMLVTGNTPDNCKSFQGSAENQCYEPMIYLQHFYPGSAEAKWAWQFATLGDRIFKYDELRTGTGLRILLARMLFETGQETSSDWTQELPTHLISTQPAAGATQGLGFLISKTDWTSSACTSYMWTPVGWGEKWLDFVPVGHYGIGCDGDMFIGMAAGNPMAWIDTYHNGNYERSADRQAVVIAGVKTYQKGDAYAQTVGINSDTDAWFTSKIDLRHASSTHVYARADLKDWLSNEAGKTGTAFSRNYRHFVHFKPANGKQRWIVLDDVGLTVPHQLRSQIPYNNNGKTLTGYPQQGWTTLDTTGTKVTSVSYRPTQKMVSTLVRGGSFYTSDLNVIQQTAQSRFVIGPTCADDHPCRIRMTATGVVTTFGEPATVLYTPADRTNEFIAWFDPADRMLHAAVITNALGTGTISCQGPITCEQPVPGWPTGVVRLHLYRQYPNTTCGSSSALSSNGYESYHCGTNGGASNVTDEDNQVVITDKDSDIVKRLFMSNGYASSGGQYLVVHEVLPQSGTEDAATELTTIDPNFIGIQVGGTSPQVAVFGKGTLTSLFSETSFTTAHAGVGQYLVGGLNPGIYDIVRSGTPIQSNIAVAGSEGSVYFESQSGSFSIRQSGTLPSLVISTSSLPNGVTGIPYTQSLAATGGTAPYSWAIQSGSLPAGLTLGTSGTISGTPNKAGTSTFVVRVTDATSSQAIRTMTLAMMASTSVRIVTPSLSSATAGVSFQISLQAQDGTPPYAWSITSGGLPPGLSITSDGVIQGRPLAAGSGTFTVKVTSSDGTTDSHTYTLTVNAETQPLNITSPASLLPGNLGELYLTNLTTSGGTAPYTWSVTEGSLPPGVTLSGSGALQGTPVIAGTFNFTVQVSDLNGNMATQQLSVDITGVDPLALLTQAIPSGYVGQGYSYTLAAAGGLPPYSWSIAGNLPSGLAVDSQTGKIEGVPLVAADTMIRASVTDANGGIAEQELVISTLQPIDLSNLEITPLSRQAIVKYGFAGLLAETTCTVDARSMDASGPVVYSVTDEGGPSRRMVALSNLDPAAIHSVELRCGTKGGRTAFQTRGTTTGIAAVPGTVLKVQMVSPPAIPVAKLRLNYGLDPMALTSNVTVQCSGKCETSISTVPDSILYLRASWLDAQDQVLTTGTMKLVAVP